MMDVNEILEMNKQTQELVMNLQASLPPGLRCALVIFTADRGPMAFAHTTESRKMISILEDIIRKLKEKGENNNTPLLIG